jgi:hypothetical protein
MIKLPRGFNGHLYMITSLLSIGNVGSGLMSAQLSVEKEANGTLYTGSGVSEGQHIFDAIY